MGSDQTILVVEEDASCRAFLADNLAEDGYRVASAETRDQALALLANRRAHLVLADLNGQTLGLLDAVRGAGGLRDGIDPHVPLVVLSSRTDELARVRALERGADDVLAKPFSYPELRARVGAVLRRCYGRPRQVLRVGSLTLDRGTRRAWIGQHEVGLSVKEFELLAALAAEPERVHTKAELLRAVWGLGSWARTRTLDSHVISSPTPSASSISPALSCPSSPSASCSRMGGRRGRCWARMGARSRRWWRSCATCTGSSARRIRCARMRMI